MYIKAKMLLLLLWLLLLVGCRSQKVVYVPVTNTPAETVNNTPIGANVDTDAATENQESQETTGTTETTTNQEEEQPLLVVVLLEFPMVFRYISSFHLQFVRFPHPQEVGYIARH